jgi:high-affinity iron transporter
LAFREALEAALITAIILAYLKRTGRTSLGKYVRYGTFAAIAASFGVGVTVWVLFGSLTETVKALFEGVAALFAVLVLSSMIYWMATKGRELKSEIEERVKSLTVRGATLALASFSFIVVFREGLETVLFMTPFLLSDTAGTIVGALFGVASALAVAYAIFVAGMRINIRRFFYFTSILLVLLAGGLIGYGVHELVEYSDGVAFDLGWLGDYAYTLDIPSGHPLHHKGVVGSIFAVMFGYTVKAEWIRVLSHLGYLVVALPLVVLAYSKSTN